jgi:repressor LexA
MQKKVDTIANRIRTALDIRNMKQADLVEKTKIGKSSISTYLSGAYEPKQKNIYRIASALDVDESWLMGFDVPMERKNTSFQTSKGIKIPVLGRVPAGVPIEAVEDIIDYEEIPVEMAKDGEFFGLQIKGDSMEPRICEGDVVIVHKQDDAESGDLVIAMINGDEATCKRLMKYSDGIRLMPSNPTYEPLYFSNKEIEEKPVKIIGRVVENRQKY